MAAFRAASLLSATPNANTCSRSFVICQCHSAPSCQIRQPNVGSVKKNSRSKAGTLDGPNSDIAIIGQNYFVDVVAPGDFCTTSSFTLTMPRSTILRLSAADSDKSTTRPGM
jgi:hypothetical protein